MQPFSHPAEEAPKKGVVNVATPAKCDMKSFVFGVPVFHSAGALLHQVSCRQVSDVELYSEGIAVVGIAHGKAAAADGIIKPTHMPADSNSSAVFKRMKCSMRYTLFSPWP